MKAKQITEAVDNLAKRFIKEYEPLSGESYEIGGARFYSGSSGYVSIENESFEITRYSSGDVIVTFKLSAFEGEPTWKHLSDVIKVLDNAMTDALKSRKTKSKVEKKAHIAKLEAEIEELKK